MVLEQRFACAAVDDTIKSRKRLKELRRRLFMVYSPNQDGLAIGCIESCYHASVFREKFLCLTTHLWPLGECGHRLADGSAIFLEIPATCANDYMKAQRSFLFKRQGAFMRERNQLGGFVTAKHLNVP